MKKVFCDVCGKEMDYNQVPGYLKNGAGVVSVPFADSVKRSVSVRVMFDFSPSDGQHLDVCGNCRLSILDRMDTRPKVWEESWP